MMNTEDFIIELFCRVDDEMKEIPKHPQSKLYPSEIVTIGLLYAIKGVGQRAFYRWLKRDYLHLFPHFPERTSQLDRTVHGRPQTDRQKGKKQSQMGSGR